MSNRRVPCSKTIDVIGACLAVSAAFVVGCGGMESPDTPAVSDGPAVGQVQQAAITGPIELPPNLICKTGFQKQCTPISPAGSTLSCSCVPLTQNFTIIPDFYVTHVFYAPPGKSSTISYSNSSTTGATTSATSGFTSDTKVTASASGSFLGSGSVSVSAGVAFGNTSTDAVDVAETWTQGYKKTGQVDGVNHDYDEIWFLIHPAVNVAFRPAGGSQPASVKWTFAPSDGSTTDIQAFAYAGWLAGTIPMPANVQNLLNSYGITPNKYGALLSADPLFGFGTNQTMDATRFDYIGEFPYVPPLFQGDQPSTQTYSVDQKTTNSSTIEGTNSISVGMSVMGGFDIGAFNAKLTVSQTWTWTNKSSSKESNGSGTTDAFTVGQPAYGYSGPVLLHVFEDKIYKTYAFTLDGPAPEPFYDYATQCTVGGRTMHCCPTGSAMVGVRLDQNAFKCAWLQNPTGAVTLDLGTQRNNMHACPFGSVMVGLRADQNALACQQIVANAINAERVDVGTQDGYPMHVCESTVSTQAMSGIRADQNLLTCATNANFR